MPKQTIEGNLVDILKRKIYPAKITIENGKIINISKTDKNYSQYVLPGFIDAHIHIESSMLPPYEFARIAMIHGTVATVSDPHEIANVLGIEGIEFMIKNAEKSPLKIMFGAPSCVPATSFETSGAKIKSDDIDYLLERSDIGYLSEVMNFPAVINNEKDIINKIHAAIKHKKPIDGHAPGLIGEDLKKYFSHNISTDHESLTMEEAEEKIKYGVKIQIREGSAAKNFDALSPLIDKYPDKLMFCSDDLHPDDLSNGHINRLVSRAIKQGYNLWNVLKIASYNPITHYNLPVGLLRIRDSADFIISKNLADFDNLTVYIGGEKVAENGKPLIDFLKAKPVNNFNAQTFVESDFAIETKSDKLIVIKAYDKQLFTEKEIINIHHPQKNIVSDTRRDILKIAVVNRYKKAKPAIGFIKNFGLKTGAIASSVAHDSHNIVVVGVTDYEIAQAVNMIIKNKGGLSVFSNEHKMVLPLPIAGLMSNKNYNYVAENYMKITKYARSLGCKLHSPFMTLSFMALPVIPKLKITDKYLFDVERFLPCEAFE